MEHNTDLGPILGPRKLLNTAFLKCNSWESVLRILVVRIIDYANLVVQKQQFFMVENLEKSLWWSVSGSQW